MAASTLPSRRLPIAPVASPGRRNLPLAADAREIDRAYRPIYAVWELTLACDLACGHCGSRAGHARPDELSTSEALDLAEQLADIGKREVTLIGGEVYLRNDWVDIVRALRRRGLTVSITSGGRGLSEEIVALAKDAGVTGVSISIDGDETAHDSFRGRGAYRAAFDALARLRARDLRMACNTQINRRTMGSLAALLEDIAAAGVEAWQVQLTVPMGRAADDPEMLLQPYDLLEVFPMLARLKARCDDHGIRLWPGGNVGYFGPYATLFRVVQPRGGSCSSGRGTIGIEANGAIKGCPSLPTAAWTGGNVRDERLVAIWERAEALRYTRDRTTADLWGYCRDCYYAEECMSGCTWTSFVTLGRPGNNPYCHHRALEMERAGRRERIVKVADAPGAPFDHGRFELVEEEIGCSPAGAP